MAASRAFKLFGLIIGVVLILQFSGLFGGVLQQTVTPGNGDPVELRAVIFVGVFVWLGLFAILLISPALNKLGDNKENFALVLSLILAGIAIQAPNFVFNVWKAATLGFGLVGILLVIAAIVAPIIGMWFAGNKAIDLANSAAVSTGKGLAASAEIAKKTLGAMNSGGDKMGEALEFLTTNPNKALRKLNQKVAPFQNGRKHRVNDFLQIITRITSEMPNNAVIDRMKAGFFNQNYSRYMQRLHQIITQVYATCNTPGFLEEDWLRNLQQRITGSRMTQKSKEAFEEDITKAQESLAKIKSTLIGYLRNADSQLYNALGLYNGRNQNTREEAATRIAAVKDELGKIPDMIDTDFKEYTQFVAKIQKDVEDADREGRQFRNNNTAFTELQNTLNALRVTTARYINTGTEIEPNVESYENAFNKTTSSIKAGLDAVSVFIDSFENNTQFTLEHHRGALIALVNGRLTALERGVLANTGLRNFTTAVDAIVANIQTSIAGLSATQQADIMKDVNDGRNELITNATNEITAVKDLLASARNTITRIEADPKAIKADIETYVGTLK